jgi:hypothetical protein
MLKKNQPVKFAKPMSTMRQVLSAVEHGFETEAPKAPQADSLAPVDVYPDNPLYY